MSEQTEGRRRGQGRTAGAGLLPAAPAPAPVAHEALRRQGAREVHVFATHALFVPGTPARLEEAGVTTIAVTDTVPLDGSAQPDSLTVLSTADLLAGTIRNVFAERSVSELFAGENELF